MTKKVVKVDPDLLLPSEVAQLFRVDPKTVTRWAKDLKISSLKTPGGHHRFPRKEVEALLAQRSTASILAAKLTELENMIAARRAAMS